MYVLEWNPEMEMIILCERFYDHRVLSRKYEAGKKDMIRDSV